jgi:glutaminyl-peptide cyclotransferase
MKNKILLAVLVLFVSAAVYKACKDVKPEEVEIGEEVKPDINTKLITYKVMAEYPHDTATYTQGLEFYKGKLYESGGDFKSSVLRFGDVKTGGAEKKNMMGTDEIFAEGITILNEKIYQLTWQSHDVFVYNVNDITKPIQRFTWPLDGWGITNDGKNLLITTGDTKLYTVDPLTFKVIKSVEITNANGPIKEVNESEYVDGFVWGNIYQTKDIIKFNPETGKVVGKMNFNDILDPKDAIGTRAEFMNGIAFDSTSKTFFVTGKRWPKMFQIKVD